MHTQVESWYDITDYGSGPVWDTAISSAITAITGSAAQTGVLYIPPGTYIIHNSIDIPSEVTVMGCGSGVSTLSMSAAGLSLPVFVTPTGFASVSITGLSVTYNGAAASGAAGVNIPGSTGVRISDVTINGAFRGVHISGTSDAAGSSEQVFCDRVVVNLNSNGDAAFYVGDGAADGANQNIHFTNCVATGLIDSGNAFSLLNCSDVFITNCLVSGYFLGIYISPSRSSPLDTVSNIFIANSVINGCESAAMEIEQTAATNLVSGISCSAATLSSPTEK